jgi:lysozyme
MAHYSLGMVALLVGCAGQVGGAGDDTATSSDALRVCAGGEKVAGLDVSYYQGVVSWDRVATVGGKSFAFIRVSDGWFKDPRFDQNWQGASDAGLYRGAYQYFRAGQDPIEQANLLLDAIGGQLGDMDLPPVLDLETKDGVSSTTVIARVLDWTEHVQKAIGRAPVIYTGVGFTSEIGNPRTIAAYPLWVANWTSGCPAMPPAWSGWQFWQNRDNGSVAGVPRVVDLDYFNGSAEDLAAYAGPNGP